MSKQEAIKQLLSTICDEASEKAIHSGSPWIAWQQGDEEITLDGDFTLSDLEAIVAIMRP